MEAALKKLKKENIAVYDCTKEGIRFIFSVKDKDTKKVFAIFKKPCYNIRVEKLSFKTRVLNAVKLRAGLVAGGLFFICACIISNSFVLKIEVSGSGDYLEPEVKRIVLSEGARIFGSYSDFNKISATGRILSLPGVTFCNVEKRGSILVVDVQVSGEDAKNVNNAPLVADIGGVLKRIVAVCGTAAVSAGDVVSAGDTLIYPHIVAGESNIDCLAAGFAEIECSGHAEYFSTDDSEQSLKEAYSSLLLEDGKILSVNHTIKPTEGGVIFVLDFTYLHKVSINTD